jgi:nucleoid-associated protein YgaU
MGFPDLFKLEKLKIHAFPDAKREDGHEIHGSPFEAMFNPQTLKVTNSSVFKPGKAVGGAKQTLEFVRIQPSNIELTLLFDGTGVGEMGLVNLLSDTKTVKQRIDSFLAVVYKPQSDTHEPTFLKLKWGKFSFNCRLLSVTANYTSFERSGDPLRAELYLVLGADDDIAKQDSLLGFTSPDVSHARLVRGGDTLPLMTKAVYRATVYVPRVARANGLDRIRGLEPGQTLIFPPLKR